MGGISMLGGLASSIMSSVEGNKAAEAARAAYEDKKTLIDNVFNKQYYQDITKRTDVQNMMRLLRENQEQQAKRDDAAAAITGATPESQLAAQGNRNKSYADAMAEIASNASQLKDAYMQSFVNQRLGLVNPEESIYRNNSNMWSQAGEGLFKSGMNMMASTDWSKLGGSTPSSSGGGDSE